MRRSEETVVLQDKRSGRNVVRSLVIRAYRRLRPWLESLEHDEMAGRAAEPAGLHHFPTFLCRLIEEATRAERYHLEFGVVGQRFLFGYRSGLSDFLAGPAESLAESARSQRAMASLPADQSSRARSLSTAIAAAVTDLKGRQTHSASLLEQSIELRSRRKSRWSSAGGSEITAHTLPSWVLPRSRRGAAQRNLVNWRGENDTRRPKLACPGTRIESPRRSPLRCLPVRGPARGQ